MEAQNSRGMALEGLVRDLGPYLAQVFGVLGIWGLSKGKDGHTMAVACAKHSLSAALTDLLWGRGEESLTA